MLDAAVAVVLEKGPGRLSLDAVAERAGVSKGGVMYHFPTKDALLEALLDRVIAHNRSCCEVIEAGLAESPGRALRAYVLNSTRPADEDDRVSGALIAVLNASPALKTRVATYFEQRFRGLIDGASFEHAGLVHLATEGLWLMELFGVSPLTENERARVVDRLLELAERVGTGPT